MTNENKNSSADGGIISQYGFHYQKIVFVYSILSTLSSNLIYTYEGIDDVEISEQNNDSLIVIETDMNQEVIGIQAKTGTVGKGSFYNVIGNWLLGEISKPSLIFEESIPTDCKDTKTVASLIEYFLAGKDRKRNSISHRVYEKYNLSSSSEDKLRADLYSLLDRAKFQHFTPDFLWKTALGIFMNTYCDDIVSYDRAKEERFRLFFSEINNDIEDCLGRKKRCVLSYRDIFNIIMHTREEISDHRYEIDVSLLKKRNKEKALKLVAEGKMREISQLLKIDNRQEFAINEITKELLYKDFRDVYVHTPSGRKIFSLEEEASSNHEETIYELGAPSARDDFFTTTKKELHSDIIPESSLYRNGCYVYLTGAEVTSDKKITWGSLSNDESD